MDIEFMHACLHKLLVKRLLCQELQLQRVVIWKCRAEAVAPLVQPGLVAV
jgi:hypothetical protein